MLKRLISQLILNIRNSSLARDKKHLITTTASVVIVLAVLVVIIIFRADTAPAREHTDDEAVTAAPGVSDSVDSALTNSDQFEAEIPETPAPTPTPTPTPTPEPPAITPPADESDPSSSTDVSFESTPPSTDTDID